MTRNRQAFTRFTIFANPRPENCCADESCHAPYHMNSCRSGKIMEPHLCQEATAPDPVTRYWINQGTDYCTVDTVGFKFRPLRHRARNNRRCRRTKHRLEKHVSRCRHRKFKRVHCKNVDTAKDSALGSKHNTKTNDPIENGTETKIHHVFHDDVPSIFRSGKTSFYQGEACLHEKYQKCRNQRPNHIHRRKHKTTPFSTFLNRQKILPKSKIPWHFKLFNKDVSFYYV